MKLHQREKDNDGWHSQQDTSTFARTAHKTTTSNKLWEILVEFKTPHFKKCFER
jgi:hypothetical protein